MRPVQKACGSSSAIPSWWSTQPSRVTLMLKVKSPMRRVLRRTSLADVLAPALVGRDDPPPDPGGAGLDRLLDRRGRHTAARLFQLSSQHSECWTEVRGSRPRPCPFGEAALGWPAAVGPEAL